MIGRLVESPRNWLGLPDARPGLSPVLDEVTRLLAAGELLVHGSGSRTIEELEPRDQPSYRGRPVRAVFASAEPVWSAFFALTDTATVGSRWNACLPASVTGARWSRFFFSVGCDPELAWTHGALYLLPRDRFAPSDDPAEWICTEPVRPVAVVPLSPEDFPFRDRVLRHRDGEPEWRREARLLASAVRRRPGRATLLP